MNEYDELKSKGYTEDGSLIIEVDDITQMNLTTEQVRNAEARQKVRADKGVVVRDKYGNERKISSLMFGYNKNNVQLADGSFANADDLMLAMRSAIERLDKGTVIIDKKGKKLNPEQLLKVVKEAAGQIIIGNRSEKITNQDSRTWSVVGAGSDKVWSKGIAFLGNRGVELAPGTYVSVKEFLSALNEYMIMKPEVKAPVYQVPVADKKPKHSMVKIVRKYKDRIGAWLGALAIMATLGSGIKKQDDFTQGELITEKTSLEYTAESLGEERMEDILGKIPGIGGELSVSKGTEFTSNSQGGVKGVIGEGLRDAGNYKISGASIVYGNSVIAYTDLSIDNPGYSVADFVIKTCEEKNLELDNVEIKLHLGSDKDFTRAGWFKMSDLIKSNSYDEKMVVDTYQGVEKDFNGTSITINMGSGATTIRVVDENGNLLRSGSTVIGSDGKEYEIGNLSVKTEEAIEELDVANGKKLTWDIKACSPIAGIIPLLGAVAAAVHTKKKNDEAKKNPTYFEFENETEYLRFKKEFQIAQEKYKKGSKFGRLLRKVFIGKKYDVLQTLTPEQSRELYARIINCHTADYSYDSSHKISFKSGRIIVNYKDGGVQDITDIVMPFVNDIATNNDVVADGLLTEEVIKHTEGRGR